PRTESVANHDARLLNRAGIRRRLRRWIDVNVASRRIELLSWALVVLLNGCRRMRGWRLNIAYRWRCCDLTPRDHITDPYCGTCASYSADRAERDISNVHGHALT